MNYILKRMNQALDESELIDLVRDAEGVKSARVLIEIGKEIVLGVYGDFERLRVGEQITDAGYSILSMKEIE